jgi:hypothetical protein
MSSEHREIKCTGIFLATPAYSGVTAQFYDAMVSTLMWLSKNGVPFTVGTAIGDSLVARARNNLVAAFMASGCSHMLFIDADITWLPQSVTRLLAVDKDMACGVYVKKQLPPEFVFNTVAKSDGECNVDPETGVIEINHAPTGFLMIKRSVIEKLMDAHPELKYRESKSVPDDRQKFSYGLFDTELRDGDYWGEDFTFSNRWRALGGSIWLDPTIKLQHWGMFAYEGDLSTIFKGLFQ